MRSSLSRLPIFADRYTETVIAVDGAKLVTTQSMTEDTGLREFSKIEWTLLGRVLYTYREENGEPLTIRSQQARTVPLRAFSKWLCRNNHLLYESALCR